MALPAEPHARRRYDRNFGAITRSHSHRTPTLFRTLLEQVARCQHRNSNHCLSRDSGIYHPVYWLSFDFSLALDTDFLWPNLTHALPIFHITSTYRACPAVHRRADGFGLYGYASRSRTDVIGCI